ncbi:MAG: cupredoxin family copper-binding protein [Bacteriovorax sp.]|nr:cupredoxin family copper-binding protein [Bacteriovorax sp.]
MKNIVFISVLLSMIILGACGLREKPQKNLVDQPKRLINNWIVQEDVGSSSQVEIEKKEVEKKEEEKKDDRNMIEINNFSFVPKSIKIKKGEKVTWVNSETAPHTIKTDMFTSEILSKGQSFIYTFEKEGTYNYICSLHPSMKGEVIVE